MCCLINSLWYISCQVFIAVYSVAAAFLKLPKKRVLLFKYYCWFLIIILAKNVFICQCNMYFFRCIKNICNLTSISVIFELFLFILFFFIKMERCNNITYYIKFMMLFCVWNCCCPVKGEISFLYLFINEHERVQVQCHNGILFVRKLTMRWNNGKHKCQGMWIDLSNVYLLFFINIIECHLWIYKNKDK